MTAASAEVADSYEAYRFILQSARGVSREEPGRVYPPSGGQSDDTFGSSQSSQIAPSIDHTAQFQDLHDRLENMAHQFDSLLREVKGLGDKSEGRHQELSRNIMSADRLNAMDKRLETIEKTVRDYQGQFSSLQSILRDSHSSLTENLPKHMSDSKVVSFLRPASPLLTTRTSYYHQSTPDGTSCLCICRAPTDSCWFLCSI